MPNGATGPMQEHEQCPDRRPEGAAAEWFMPVRYGMQELAVAGTEVAWEGHQMPGDPMIAVWHLPCGMPATYADSGPRVARSMLNAAGASACIGLTKNPAAGTALALQLGMPNCFIPPHRNAHAPQPLMRSAVERGTLT